MLSAAVPARKAQENNPQALVKVNNAIARIEKREEDVDDFLNRHIYTYIAKRIDVTPEQAKMFYQYRHDDGRKLFATPELFDAALARYREYIKEEAKLSRGRGGSRGFDGAGSRTTTGGREAGRKAGESIRMTGAKGSLGSGQKQIN